MSMSTKQTPPGPQDDPADLRLAQLAVERLELVDSSKLISHDTVKKMLAITVR